jgi:hypothetical protein
MRLNWLDETLKRRANLMALAKDLGQCSGAERAKPS